jgi:transposase-like protein
MDPVRFDKLKVTLARDLTIDQCVELEALLGEIAARRMGELSFAGKVETFGASRSCPWCSHIDVVKHGQDNTGRQRFRCRKGPTGGCGRTFNAMTGTPFARMRMPDKWAAFASMMDGSMSLDEIHKSGIDISRLTAWRWRHRMLHAQSTVDALEVQEIVDSRMEKMSRAPSDIAAPIESAVDDGSLQPSGGLKPYVEMAVKRGMDVRVSRPKKD